MIRAAKHMLKANFLNIPGKGIKDKVLVFESDDWGTIRTPNRDMLKFLEEQKIQTNRCHYTRFDSLESAEDLEALFDLLSRYKDSVGQHPVITANLLTANPDFDKIKASGFNEYYHETVMESFNKRDGNDRVFSLWKEGQDRNLFYPQLHGREHLNISRWMTALRSGSKETHALFEYRCFGISQHISQEKRGSYLAAFDGGKKELLYDRSAIVNEATHMFKSMFHRDSASFIAPNYVWDEEIEKALNGEGIRFIQGSRMQAVSGDYGTERIKNRHYHGQRSTFNQVYLIRNVEFEPSSNPDADWTNRSMAEIAAAFRFGKPAIVSVHRVNFIGGLDPQNRSKGLESFESLIKNVLKKWPEVRFMHSETLANTYYRNAI
jgi:hypothetical protein